MKRILILALLIQGICNAPVFGMVQEITLNEMYFIMPIDDTAQENGVGRPDPNQFHAFIDGNQLLIEANTKAPLYIESNILLDSIIFERYANCGIVFDNIEDEDSTYIAATIDAFDEAYALRPDYFVTFTRDGDEILEPLGSLDEAVFYNDKNNI